MTSSTSITPYPQRRGATLACGFETAQFAANRSAGCAPPTSGVRSREVSAPCCLTDGGQARGRASRHDETKSCVCERAAAVIEPDGNVRCGFCGAVSALSVGGMREKGLRSGTGKGHGRAFQLTPFGFPGKQDAIKARFRVSDRHNSTRHPTKRRVSPDFPPRIRTRVALRDVPRVAFGLRVEARRVDSSGFPFSPSSAGSPDGTDGPGRSLMPGEPFLVPAQRTLALAAFGREAEGTGLLVGASPDHRTCRCGRDCPAGRGGEQRRRATASAGDGLRDNRTRRIRDPLRS